MLVRWHVPRHRANGLHVCQTCEARQSPEPVARRLCADHQFFRIIFMNNQDAGSPGATTREQIAVLLSRYPQLSDEELNEIHDWFKRGASALDLGLLASDPDVAPTYRAYRAKHYDRITLMDSVRAAAALLVVAAIVAGLVLLAH
jgi:hypothetical protein